MGPAAQSWQVRAKALTTAKKCMSESITGTLEFLCLQPRLWARGQRRGRPTWSWQQEGTAMGSLNTHVPAPGLPGVSVPEHGSLRRSWWIADSLKAEEAKRKDKQVWLQLAPAPPSPIPRLDTSCRCPRRPNTALQASGCQERALTLKINLHSAHTVFRVEILPLLQ